MIDFYEDTLALMDQRVEFIVLDCVVRQSFSEISFLELQTTH